MKLKHMVLGTALAAMVGASVMATHAQAQGSIYVPLFTYRTGPFAGSGIPVANGMHDYLSMLNERDGGIGGVKLDIEECETGYDTKKGVECWESVKGKNPAVVNPYSTGITLQLIPKAAVDKIPILSMAYGLSASADGKNFPWVFNPPATYWDGLSMIMKYIGDKEGGLAKLKGKTIGFIFLESGYGREPIPLLEQYAKDYGFEVKLYSVAGKEMQDQSGQWLAVRRDRPAWMIMWGWGAMNPTAVKRAAETNYPMEKFIGIWWSGSDDDARGGGQGAKGYLSLNFNGLGDSYPAIQAIKKHVVDAGKSQVDKDKFADKATRTSPMASTAASTRMPMAMSSSRVVFIVPARFSKTTSPCTRKFPGPSMKHTRIWRGAWEAD
jgi:branched-chain amino acid transport system substrate-binding protein